MKEKWWWRALAAVAMFLMGIATAFLYLIPNTKMPKIKELGNKAREKKRIQLENMSDSAVVDSLPNAGDVRDTINDPAPAGDAKVHGDRWGTGSIFPGK